LPHPYSRPFYNEPLAANSLDLGFEPMKKETVREKRNCVSLLVIFFKNSHRDLMFSKIMIL
jgi:hypothetical protein